MNLQTISFFTTTSLATFALTSCDSLPEQKVYNYIQTYKYTPMIPPRSDRGPGWTFQILEDMNGNKRYSEVCNNILTVLPKPGKLTLSKVHDKNDASLKVKFSIAEELIETPIDFELASSSVDDLKISWQDVRDREIPLEDWFTVDGKAKPISKQCYAALNDIKSKNNFKRVYVIQSVLSADSGSFELKKKRNTSAGININWDSLIKVDASGKYETDGDTTLIFKEKRNIGYIAYKITDWIPTGLVGPKSARVYVKPATSLELDGLDF